jgi:ABC-2 type transport system ATP-binding protein
LTVLSFEDVTKRYGKTDGVHSLSFAVDAGQVVGLLGPNGSGKTTLLRLAAGMLRPSAGRVLVRGGPPRRARAHFAFHSTTNYYSRWMKPDSIERLMSSLYADFSSERFAKLIADLDVPDRAFVALSRGNQTKLALAATLARQVDLYLLDEPLAGIDFTTREAIIEALISEWRDEATLILSTHEIRDAEALFDRVVIMREGGVVLDERAQDLRARGQSVVDAYRSTLQ